MTDEQRLRITIRALAKRDPAALDRLHGYALALLLAAIAGPEEARRVGLEIAGQQVIREALGVRP